MLIIINCYGFFSNFLKALNWLIVKEKTNEVVVPYFIDRGREFMTGMCREDKQIYPDKDNIWNEMFVPLFKYTIEDMKNETNTFTLDFPSKEEQPFPINQFYRIYCDCNVYSSPLFPQLRELYHDVFRKLQFTPKLISYIDSLNCITEPENTIAIFIRYQYNYNYRYTDFLQNILKELREHAPKYKYMFLVCQVGPINDAIKQEFGEKVIAIKGKNIFDTTTKDWGAMTEWNYEKESFDVFTEVYLASKCAFILSGSSNMLLGALFMNTNVKFQLFNFLRHFNGA